MASTSQWRYGEAHSQEVEAHLTSLTKLQMVIDENAEGMTESGEEQVKVSSITVGCQTGCRGGRGGSQRARVILATLFPQRPPTSPLRPLSPLMCAP